jgi:hypothetical protein
MAKKAGRGDFSEFAAMNFLPGEQLGFFVRMQNLFSPATAIPRELNYG